MEESPAIEEGDRGDIASMPIDDVISRIGENLATETPPPVAALPADESPADTGQPVQAGEVARAEIPLTVDPGLLAALQPLPEADRSGELSDEQDFEAVTERETIESDAERLRRQQAELKVFDPAPLPEIDDAVSLAAYAFNTEHAVGERIFDRRDNRRLRRKAARLCAEFPDPEAAQRLFLDEGGPESDSRGLDPDGDGFVCGWSPDPYRVIVN